MAMLPNRNKGSGFTNINRILDANRGNKLGQTVASGVQNQVNTVNNRLQNDTTNFNQKAQENRLDTDENKQQRDNVIGRFGDNSPQSGFAPNMDNFQASSGLQEQYNNAKSKFETQQNDLKSRQTTLQSQYDKDKAEFDRLKQLQAQFQANGGAKQVQSGFQAANINTGIKPGTDIYGEMVYGPTGELEHRTNTQMEELKQLQSQIGRDDILKIAEAEYNKGLEAERQKYIDDQRRIFETQKGPTDEELKQFERFRGGKYEGPAGLENLDSIMADAQNAQILGDLTRTGGGKQELLRRFVGGNNYTQGQKNLDSILLNDDPTINGIRKSTRGVAGDVNKAGLAASGFANELTNRAKKFGNETVEQLQANINPLSSQIDQRLTDIQANEAKQAQEYEALRKALQVGGIKTATDKGLVNSFQADALNRATALNSTQNLLGFNKDRFNNNAPIGKVSGNPAFNTNNIADMGQLLTANLRLNEAQNVNRAGAADINQESRMNALQRLLGQNAEFANPGQDYVASKANLDFDTANQQINDIGMTKFNELINSNRGMTANSDQAKKNRDFYIRDAQSAMDLWKKQSKYYGYDPENQ